MAKPTGDIISGMGEFVLATLGMPTDFLINFEPIEFSIEPNLNKVESRKFKNGIKVRAGTAINELSHVLKMSVEAVHWQIIELAYGYRSGLIASVPWSARKEKVVPASGNIVDLDITSSDLMVTIQDATGEYKPMAAGTGAGQYTVTPATNTLSVGAGNAGRVVIYRVITPLANVQGLGYDAAAAAFSALTFNGVGYMGHAKMGVIVDKMALANEPTISASDVGKLDFEFDLIPVGDAPKGYKLLKIDY